MPRKRKARRAARAPPPANGSKAGQRPKINVRGKLGLPVPPCLGKKLTIAESEDVALENWVGWGNEVWMGGVPRWAPPCAHAYAEEDGSVVVSKQNEHHCH